MRSWTTGPVATISDEDVHKVLAQFIARRGLAAEKAEARKHHAPDSFNILDLVTSLRLTMRAGQLQGPHPVHGSETGMNFSVDPAGNVWHCFRCDSGGGPYHLLAVLERIIDCQDSQPGVLRGELFKRVRDIAFEKGLAKKITPLLTITEEKPQLLTEDAEPHEVAEALLGILHIHSIFEGEIYVYRDGVYKPGGEAVIRQIVEENFHRAGADSTAGNHFHNEILGHIQRRTYADPDIFDADPSILNLENGLLNVETSELKPHSPDYPSLAKLPVKYDPAVDCPGWKRFTSQVLHAEDVDAVQEFCGSLLEKHYRTQKGWLQGGEGSNGKDTFDRVLTSLLGPENVANRSLQDLENNRFAKAELYGKLANIYSDLTETALKTTGSFKTLTGEGSLAAERKFQNGFNFANHAKLIFSCNRIPGSPDDSDAFFRRWFITTFPNTFRWGENADPNLTASLTTPEELSGILNWLLEGLRRLRDQNWQLSNSKSVDQIRQDYVRKSDPVKAFVIECTLPDAEGFIGKQWLYQAFVRYCIDRKVAPVTSDTFFKNLPKTGLALSAAKLGPEGSRVASFKGLWLRDPKNWGREADPDERPVTDHATLDLALRREKGGQPGQGGREKGVDVQPVYPVEGLPPKVQVVKCEYCHEPMSREDYQQHRCPVGAGVEGSQA